MNSALEQHVFFLARITAKSLSKKTDTFFLNHNFILGKISSNKTGVRF